MCGMRFDGPPIISCARYERFFRVTRFASFELLCEIPVERENTDRLEEAPRPNIEGKALFFPPRALSGSFFTERSDFEA